ncbi:hypothetical protein, partial [Plasmodium yoelii yoelii]
MGVGEKTAALEVFHPDRVASRRRAHHGQGQGGKTRQEDPQRQAFRPQRLPRPVTAAQEHGRPRRHAGQAAGRGERTPARQGQDQRQGDVPAAGDDRFHDPRRTVRPRHPQPFPQAPYHPGLGHRGAGPEPHAQTARADAENDEEAQGRQHHEPDERHARSARPPAAVLTGAARETEKI